MKKEWVITSSQMEKIKHCIGFDKSKVKGTKYRTMHSYRNYYTTSGNIPELDNLVDQGIMIKRCHQHGCGSDQKLYYLSQYGYELLSDITGIKITEMD